MLCKDATLRLIGAKALFPLYFYTVLLQELNHFLDRPGVLLDVRSPGEFQRGHVPGAQSFPLFDDEERARIGTLYKLKGREAAVLEGLQVVSGRMVDMVLQARELSQGAPLKMYCWRGGMRSGSLAWLLRTAGMEVHTLEGGYKTFRTHATSIYHTIKHGIVLLGPTGSGKTAALRAMVEFGEQVLDLEGLASHRGSAFGAIGLPEQPETQQFQNDLFEVLRHFDLNKRVWVEGESKSIGRCYLPDELWALMRCAVVLEIDLPLENRVQRLVDEYGAYDVEELRQAILKLRKRLGGLCTKQCLESLEAGALHDVVRELLRYYDEAYAQSRTQFEASLADPLVLKGVDEASFATQIIEYYNTLCKDQRVPLTAHPR